MEESRLKRLMALIAAGLCLAGAGAAGVAAQPQPAPLPLTRSQASAPAVNPIFLPNHRANTDSTTYAQQEPSIAVNPTNPLNIIASGKDERSAPGPGTATKQVWEYTSTDGGVSWLNQAAPLVGPNSTRQSDPVNIFSDTGVAYACYLGYNDGGGFTDTGIYVTRSTDGGLTWNNTVVAVPEGGSYSTDKQWLAIDNNPASPFYHRIYLSWTEFGVCSGCIHFVYSTDGGLTWSNQAVQLSTTNSGQQFSMPTVLANGNVFVNWANGSGIAARTSTDGGVTFSPQVTVGTMNTNLAMTGRNWRVNSIPVAAADRSTPGRIVIVWNDGRNNAASGVDIYSIRSSDGGATWSAPARVNDDPTGVVRHQAEPWITTSPNGLFHAIWYDEREDSSAAIIFNIYYSQSSDGGATWSTNVKASDATTDLNIGIPAGSGWNGAAGDYINLAATDTDIYGVWTDTRNGTNEDVYTFRGQLGGGTPTVTPTGTLPTATSTSQPTVTSTLSPSVTRSATALPSATATATGVAATTTTTATGVAATATATGMAATVTATATGAVVTATATAVAASVTATTTAGPPSATATVTATVCPIRFTDVTDPTAYYYQGVYYLACRGVVSGYSDGTFKPFNNTTRAQMTKIVTLAFNIPLVTPPAGAARTFTDVLPDNVFYQLIETAAHQGIVTGYTCGGINPQTGTAEPCDSTLRPYFRPSNFITRGQLTKIVVVGAGWTPINPATPTFSDVTPDNVFYPFIETAVCRGIISGYADGTFRPNTYAFRGQIAKIVYLAVTNPPPCTGVVAPLRTR